MESFSQAHHPSRRKIVSFRAKDDEWKIIAANAKAVGAPVSDYVRQVAIAGSVTSSIDRLVSEKLADAVEVMEARAVATQMRQAAHEAATETRLAALDQRMTEMLRSVEQLLEQHLDRAEESGANLFEGLRRLLEGET